MFEEMPDWLDQPVYVCSPFLNKARDQRNCWVNGGDCKHTTDITSALLDENGQPMLGETRRQWRERIMGERREPCRENQEGPAGHAESAAP